MKEITVQPKTIASILSIILLFGAFTGAAFFLEDRYAKASELKDTEERLTVHIAQDRISFLQQQIWALEDRVGKDATRMSVDQRQRYREMKSEKLRLEARLKTLK